MGGVQSLWSTIANENDDANAPAIAWREGQPPSTVNDSARGMMAAIKKAFLDIAGAGLTTAGSANAYTLTTHEGFSALVNGLHVAFKVHTANTGASTLNVDGLGAKPLRSRSGTSLLAGELQTGVVYVASYDSAQDEWLVHGYLGALSLPGALSVTGAITGTTGTLAAAATPLTLRRTENDTIERILQEWQSGDGSGAKGSLRAVGNGSHAIAELRLYIGSTEIERLTASLVKVFLDFGVGANVLLAAAGYADIAAISAPSNPAANKVRVYCRDIGGLSRLFYKDSIGTEVPLSGPWEEIGTTTVGAAVANVDFALGKVYSELLIIGVSLSCSVSGANALRVHISDNNGATVVPMLSFLHFRDAGSSLGLASSAPTLLTTASLASSTADVNFRAHYTSCNTSNSPKQFVGAGASNISATMAMNVAQTSVPCGVVNLIRVNFSSGNIDGGTITAYGRVA